MGYDFANCTRCRNIANLYPDLEPDELFNETFIRIVERYTPEQYGKNPVGLFFMVSKAAANFLRRKCQPKFDHITPIAIEWETTPPTQFQQALDNYMEKNPDDGYSNVIRMYLINPNLSWLSRETGIKKYHLKEILENGKNRIGFELLRVKSND